MHYAVQHYETDRTWYTLEVFSSFEHAKAFAKNCTEHQQRRVVDQAGKVFFQISTR